MAKRAKAAQACAVAPLRAPMQVAMLPERAGNVLTTAGLADVAVLRSQSPLPETADELCAVAGVLNAGREAVKLGSAATEADLKRMNDRKELTGYRVLHFATHGVLAGEAVGISEPGLLFSPPTKATELDDGYLSAAEISGLSLDADLVILSACNTAAGGAGDADALAGLARSFFYAGARALFVSHWAVNSQATVSLITTALATMARTPGMSYAQALRESMVSLIDSPEPYASHPAYWAPFVVAGVERADRR
jgi:CHAT domain-containing protein